MAEVTRPRRRSPLGHRTPITAESGGVRLAEQPFIGKFILRADPHETCERLRGALGLGLPFEPLTSSAADEIAALWMGPDEWMLVTSPDKGEARLGAARAALGGMHHQLTDVTDYYTAIEVAGPRSRQLLMKLTTLDLHPRAFRAGMVTGSMFGRANAILWQAGDDDAEGGPVFRLFVRWSMADYLWCVLAEAGSEWGLPSQTPVKGETLAVSEGS